MLPLLYCTTGTVAPRPGPAGGRVRPYDCQSDHADVVEFCRSVCKYRGQPRLPGFLLAAAPLPCRPAPQRPLGRPTARSHQPTTRSQYLCLRRRRQRHPPQDDKRPGGRPRHQRLGGGGPAGRPRRRAALLPAAGRRDVPMGRPHPQGSPRPRPGRAAAGAPLELRTLPPPALMQLLGPGLPCCSSATGTQQHRRFEVRPSCLQAHVVAHAREQAGVRWEC